MKILPNDPRLTAYALGEIEDDNERMEIESAVAADPELQAVVDSSRGMGDLLSDGLAAEPAPELSEFEKAKLEQKPDAPSRPAAFWAEHKRSLMGAAAALVLLGVLVPQFTTYKTEVEPRIGADLLDGVDQSSLAERDESTVASDEDGATSSEPKPDHNVGGLVKEAEEVQMDQAPVQASTPKKEAAKALGGARGGEQLSVADNRHRQSVDAYAPQMVLTTRSNLQMAPSSRPMERNWNTESYDPIEETGFRSPQVAPLSTFSIDVDTASYANVRRFLNQGQLPPADAVRIEELINYFPYDDAAPTQSLEDGGDPFAVHMDQSFAPWNPEHRLLRIALKGYEMPWEERPASNLVFLLDVSGSMSSANKLPLLQDAMELLVRRLDQRDRVAIVVYAGASGLVLPSTTANNRETIEHALQNLKAGGSTNAGAGVELAYKAAREHFIEGGNNRVILCTDGDFNVGQTNRGELAEIAEQQADAGVSLSILGFGMGNYKDDMLETLSNKGKGSYAYVDSMAEARKVFIEDLASNIFKIAKDVKIQVEFNPGVVQAYRLIGYENRRLKAEDFNNDKKKAGDIGPGHSVVALYEVVPVGSEMKLPGVDPLKYQAKSKAEAAPDAEIATVKLRYKRPDEDKSQLIEAALRTEEAVPFAKASDDLRFGAAVAGFGMLLRESEGLEGFDYRQVEQIAVDSLGQDRGGHRSEFSGLVRQAEELAGPAESVPVRSNCEPDAGMELVD